MLKMNEVFRGIQYLEIQGMDLGANNTVKLLCTPVLPPVPPVDMRMMEAPVKEEGLEDVA